MDNLFQRWKNQLNSVLFYGAVKRNAKRIDRQQRRRWDDMTKFRPLTERQAAKYCKALEACRADYEGD